jgi:proline dehydrogenase
MLRSVILAAARNSTVERLVATAPVSRDVVGRYVAGTSTADALRVAAELAADGLHASLDFLGEDSTDAGTAAATTDAYLDLLAALAGHGLTRGAEVSVKLSAIGQPLDPELAIDNARAICEAAREADTTVTLDMEDHTTTDATLEALITLRKDFPATGAVVQAYLRRTEADCKELAVAGSRVRLCKGAYAEPDSVAFHTRLEVDRSYVRCLNVLLGGEGYPMFATHDPRLVAIIEERARWYGRTPDSFEYQMLYGIRPDEQRRLADEGMTMRVYVPYGTQWYGYLMRRLAERPANVTFFLRSLVGRK